MKSLRLVAASVVGVLSIGIAPSTLAVAVPSQNVPVSVTGRGEELAESLDRLVAATAEETCLRVSVDGVVAYDHRGDDAQTPASTQKLFTSAAVLDKVGENTTFVTKVLAPSALCDGVAANGLVLVGGGDPVLTSQRYRELRAIKEPRPFTSLEALADSLVRGGLREVRGGIVVDDSRYDRERTVASWPQRYVDQGQVGPLGALVVNDGYVLHEDEDGELKRDRADDPAVGAGEELAELLRDRMVKVDGPVRQGTAGAQMSELANVVSPPVKELVKDLLLRSDNHISETLVKELGRVVSGRGTTSEGAAAVSGWAQANGAHSPGSLAVDGSGLDPTNATTCQDLVELLDVAGPAGIIDQGLPVAGVSGTLTNRFRASAAQDHLRAKTGTLNHVSALAGFVDLPEGGVATFSYIANGDIGPRTRLAETLIVNTLASWLPACPDTPPPGLEAPSVAPSLLLAQVSGQGGVVAGPALAITLDTFADPTTAPIDRCSRSAEISVALGVND